jgi:hypothetical protein
MTYFYINLWKREEYKSLNNSSMKKLLIMLLALFLAYPVSSYGQNRKHKTTASAKIGKAGQSKSTARPTSSKAKKTKAPPKSNRPQRKTTKKKTSNTIKV